MSEIDMKLLGAIATNLDAISNESKSYILGYVEGLSEAREQKTDNKNERRD